MRGQSVNQHLARLICEVESVAEGEHGRVLTLNLSM